MQKFESYKLKLPRFSVPPLALLKDDGQIENTHLPFAEKRLLTLHKNGHVLFPVLTKIQRTSYLQQ